MTGIYNTKIVELYELLEYHDWELLPHILRQLANPSDWVCMPSIEMHKGFINSDTSEMEAIRYLH